MNDNIQINLNILTDLDDGIYTLSRKINWNNKIENIDTLKVTVINKKIVELSPYNDNHNSIIKSIYLDKNYNNQVQIKQGHNISSLLWYIEDFGEFP